MSERFVSGVSAKIVLYKYSSFLFLSFPFLCWHLLQTVAAILYYVFVQSSKPSLWIHYARSFSCLYFNVMNKFYRNKYTNVTKPVAKALDILTQGNIAYVTSSSNYCVASVKNWTPKKTYRYAALLGFHTISLHCTNFRMLRLTLTLSLTILVLPDMLLHWFTPRVHKIFHR